VLVHQPGQGRPLHWSKELEELLQFAMAQRPADFGYAATGWSVPLLQDLLASIEPEQSLSCATIRRRLQSLGYVWKRSRYVLAPDPELEKKTAPSSANPGFARAQRAPGTGRDRSAALSSTACWLGTARRAAAPVPISGHNARRSVFGTLHLRTGRALFLEQRRRRAVEFQVFLEFIHWHYRAWPVALLLDMRTPSTRRTLRSRWLQELGIRLLWLPKRSPHLNPLEHLWRDSKAVVCANHQHTTLNEQTCCFIDYLQSLSPTQRLRKAGVLSNHFWLRNVKH
jgi:DDE superfamily endonuclease